MRDAVDYITELELEPPTSSLINKHKIATQTTTISAVTRKTGNPPPISSSPNCSSCKAISFARHYGGYTNLRDAVDYITELELELQRAQSTGAENSEELEKLRAEVARLKTFEDNQVEFQRIKTEFYE